MDRKLYVIKMYIFPKLIYKFNKITIRFFPKSRQVDYKIYLKIQVKRIVRKAPRKEMRVEKVLLSIKTYKSA